ncbi:MAG: zf-TFIIB domain-containing protein [Candidatus Polarisedimenticolia bacterium]
MPASFACRACGAPLDPDAHACVHCNTPALRRRCAVCFDLSLAADRNCRRCGTLLPDTVSKDPAAQVCCPGCGAGMGARALSGLSFDECERCGGLWLSPAVLDEIKDNAGNRARMRAFDAPAPDEPVAAAAAQVGYRRCPGCRKMMNRSNLAPGSGFVVDVCRDHGVFFDHGEMTRLFAFIEGGGLQKARLREEEASKERVRELRRQAIRAGHDSAMPLDPSPGWESTSALELLAQLAGRWILGR